jgi:amino-acid N-acetyltransferase
MTSPSNSTPVARRATPDDAAAIQTLIDRYVASGTLLPRSQEFITLHSQDFIVVMAGDQVVGCVHLDEYAPSLSELRSLAVHPDWQGGGIGRILVDETEKLARKRGHTTLFAVSNDEEFFHKFGFETRHIPELDLERSEVSRYKGVYAKDLVPTTASPSRDLSATRRTSGSV